MKFWIEVSDTGAIHNCSSYPADYVPAAISGGRMIWVTSQVFPTEYAYYDDVGLFPIGKQPTENSVFDYTLRMWVDPRSLDDHKLAQWEVIKLAREVAETGGFEWQGHVFDSDPVSQSRIQGAVTLSSTPGFTIEWTLKDNTYVVLDSEDMVAVGAALGLHVATQHGKARLLRTEIEAATSVAEIEQVVW